jgi:hypothetical protein
VTKLKNTIIWRKEDNNKGGSQSGGRRGQQNRGELEALEELKEKNGRQ